MAKPFARTNKYNAVDVRSSWDDQIQLRVEDEGNVVFTTLSDKEAKLLRKQLKNIINEKGAN